MTDETQSTATPAQPATTTPPANGSAGSSTNGQNGSTPAGAENTGREPLIPRERFDEVNERAKKAEAELAKIEAARKQAEEESLKAKGEWEKIATEAKGELEKLKPQAAEAEELRKVISELVDARKKNVPEHLVSLIDNLSPVAALRWLDANADKLTPPPAPNTDAGQRGERGKTPVDPSKVLRRNSY